MKRPIAALIAAALVWGCTKKPDDQADFPSRTHLGETAPAPRIAPAIDPRSSEAAALLVGGFVRLINQGRLADAYMLLGPGAPPRGQFESGFRRYSDLVVTAGRPGEEEGAAGSIYLPFPIDISGKLEGKPIKRHATLVVRRINDVPGSTEEQRRWHIERIEWEND